MHMHVTHTQYTHIHTHTHTHTHYRTSTHTQPYAHIHMPTLTHKRTDSYSLSLTLSLIRARTHTITHTFSVLEIELLYAVLMVEPEAALVYNREISYVHNEVAPEQRSKYLEVGCGEMKTAAARSAMADLRMRLRAVPDLKQRAYEHPKAIAQILKEDLVREICSKFPQSSTPTARERDRIMIESISKAHFQIIDTGIFTDMVEEIDQAIAQESCRIVLIPGAPCSGKTALCAHYKKRHVLKFMEVRDGSGVDFSSCLLNDGPRPDLTPHMLITSFISHLGDPRIDSVLRHLYSEIRRLSSSSFLLPVDGDCLENFPRFMKEEACKHGLGMQACTL